MNNLIIFINLIAWIGAISASLFTMLRITGFFLYNESDRFADKVKGQVVQFPIIIPISIALISWAWLYAFGGRPLS